MTEEQGMFSGKKQPDCYDLWSMYEQGLAAIMGYSISDACGAKGEM